MKRIILTGLMLLVVLCLQVGFLGGWRPLGVLPNLLLIALTYWGLNRPASETLAAALTGGLILDLASGADFGLRLAFYSFYALGVIYLKQRGAGQSILVVGGTLIAGTILYNLVVLSTLVAGHVGFRVIIAAKLIALELILNLLIAFLPRKIWSWSLKPPRGSLA